MNETIQERVVRLFNEARLREERPPKYGFSNAMRCGREILYAFREYERTGAIASGNSPARWNLAAVLGTAMGDFFERAARRLGDTTQRKVVLQRNGLRIEGTADWVCETHVIDFKRADDATWRSVQREPKRDHVVQVNGYAVALNKPKWGLLYVQNVSKGEEIPWLLHEGDASPDMAEQLVDHWAEVETHRKAKTLPERPFALDSFECRNCRYRLSCWSEEQ